MSVRIKPTLAHLATDPFRNFKFRVAIRHPRISGLLTMGFMMVSGLAITTEVIPYREGGMNTTTQKMPGQSDFSPITMSKGLAVGNGEMWKWMKQLFVVMQGTGSGSPGENFRFKADVKVLDHPVTATNKIPVKAWFRIYNAWPTAVSFSDLDAGANAIVVNQMTLAHEGFDVRIAKRLKGDVTQPPGKRNDSNSN